MGSSTYHLTEPHPTVPKSSYLYSGRGGAGNITHVDPRTVTAGPHASGPASRVVLPNPSQSTTSYYPAGRGGAGNMYREQERAIFSFDEELERQRRMLEHQAPVYHVGRGGAGNLVDEMHARRAAASSSSRSGSTDSTFSTESRGARRSLDGAMSRLSRAFSRQ